MILDFAVEKSFGYTNKSQIARVLTEDWVSRNGYCPNCGETHLSTFTNNRPVADFYCEKCSEQFELKSKMGPKVGQKIVDGAYLTMIERIESDTNPHFFFLTYDKSKWSVSNFLIIPKHYFTADIIEKRKPLSSNARRAGWVGCNIDLTKVPEYGRIFLIQNSIATSKEDVHSKWKATAFLRSKKGEARGWILDVMNCVDAIKRDSFTLNDVYAFESSLKEKHPNNNFIKDKIRQQLQILRDKGLIEFKERGTYKKAAL
ncbi:MAG: DpnI domain-containing protein [Mariprofundaceae bacterium]|nr:DpnI domain-containing protein [Mariprofundaceae bacterium]